MSAVVALGALVAFGALGEGPERLRLGAPWTAESAAFRVLRTAADTAEREGDLRITTPSGFRWADERALVDALKAGTLDGATLSSEGLALAFPDLCVFEAPGISPDQRETDRVRDALAARLEADLAKAGWVLLGWGELGAQYVFSVQPVRTPGDLASAHPANTQRVGVLAALWGSAKAEPVLLSPGDLASNLETGAVGAVVASPAQVVRLGWFKQLRAMTNLRVSSPAVATLVRRSAFERLSPEAGAALKRAYFRGHRTLTAQARAATLAALDVLVARGLAIVQPEQQPWTALLDAAARAAARSVYNADLLTYVQKALRSPPNP